MADYEYSYLEGAGGVLFVDAAGTASPIVAGTTDQVLVPHVSCRAVIFSNPTGSTGVVTVKTGTGSGADASSFVLGPGQRQRFTCAKMNKTAGGKAVTAFKTRFYVTTAASTTCSIAWEIDTPDGT